MSSKALTTGGNEDIVMKRWPFIAKEILDLRLPYFYDPEYERANIDRKSGFQVRDGDHIAPKDGIIKIAEMLKAGASVPPILMTRDGVMPDGNTRDGAYGLLEWPRIPAIVLDLNYQQADEHIKRKIYILAATLNAKNGQGLTESEVHRAATEMLADGYNVTEIAKRFGVKLWTIQNLKFKLEARLRLAKLGLPEDMVSETMLVILGNQGIKLNNQPFEDVAKIIADSGLRREEVLDLIKEIKEASSDEVAAEIISQRREDWDERIHEHKQKGNGGKAVPSAQLRKALGYVLKYEGDEELLVETTRSKMQEHLSIVERSIVILSELASYQKRRI